MRGEKVGMVNENSKIKEPEKETSAGTETETILLLHVIEQGVQSLLLRDKYLRILIAIQTMILIYMLLK